MRGWRVHFINVGRLRKNWHKDYWVSDQLDCDAIASEAGKALMSRGVEVTLDTFARDGRIYAGLRCVGALELEPIVGAAR